MCAPTQRDLINRSVEVESDVVIVNTLSRPANINSAALGVYMEMKTEKYKDQINQDAKQKLGNLVQELKLLFAELKDQIQVH